MRVKTKPMTRHRKLLKGSTMRNILSVLFVLLSCAICEAQQFVPICVGNATTDTANFTALKAAIGATNTGTIKIPYKSNSSQRCKLNTFATGDNITIDNTDGTGIFVVTGQTVTLGPVVNPPGKQIFYNALSGQGTVVFASHGKPVPNWWARNAIQGTTNMTAAIQAAIHSLPRGGKVELLAETYLTGQITAELGGTTLEGQGTHPSGGPRPTTLIFTGLANNSSGIVIDNVRNAMIRDIDLQLPDGTGGDAIKVTRSSGLLLENLVISSSRGSGADGIILGDRGANDANAVINSTVRNVRVAGNVRSGLLVGAGSTSIHLDTVYATTATTAGVEFYKSTYSKCSSCAVDTGGPTASGYLIDTSTDISLDTCGAENNGKGFARITGGSTGITIISGRGVGNNTSATSGFGRFLQIDTGGNYAITVIGGTDTPNLGTAEGIAQNAATTASIYGGTGTLWTNILGSNTTSMPKGIDGDPTWKSRFVCRQDGGPMVCGSFGVGMMSADPGTYLDISVDDNLLVTAMARIQQRNASAYSILDIDRASNARVAATEYSTANTGDWFTGELYNTGSASSKYAISPDNSLANAIFTVATDGVNVKAGTIQIAGNILYSPGTPSIAGNGTLNTGSRNSAGKVTATATAASTIVLTFSTTFNRAPACTATDETTAVLFRAICTTTTLTISGAQVNGDVISYTAVGY